MSKDAPAQSLHFQRFEDYVDPQDIFHDNGNGTTQNDLLEKKNDQDTQAVANQYTQSVQDGQIDSTTGKEIEAALDAKDPTSAARLLAAARTGQGVYAVRKINENQKNLIQLRPGRAQLSQRYSLVSYND